MHLPGRVDQHPRGVLAARPRLRGLRRHRRRARLGRAGADRAPAPFPALSEQPREDDSSPLGALRHSRYRIYSVGVLLSLTGTWLASAAFGYVVLLLGGSAATLGLIGFLNTIPNLIWGLPAGALADKYDTRKLMMGSSGSTCSWRRRSR